MISRLAFVFALGSLIACGGGESNNPPPNNASNVTNTSTTPPPPPPTTTGTVATPPPTGTGTPPFNLPPWNSGGNTGGSTATPMDPNVAAAATTALGAFAASEAPGMAKDGAAVAGQFTEGQTLEGAFTFQPGKCYTLVAAGVGITQLDVEMAYTTPLPGLSPSIGKGTSTGPMATMGGKGSCMKPLSPMAAPAKFIVRATKGSGIAAAQLYSK